MPFVITVEDADGQARLHYGPFPSAAAAWADVDQWDPFFGDLETDLAAEWGQRTGNLPGGATTSVRWVGDLTALGFVNAPADTYRRGVPDRRDPASDHPPLDPLAGDPLDADHPITATPPEGHRR